MPPRYIALALLSEAHSGSALQQNLQSCNFLRMNIASSSTQPTTIIMSETLILKGTLEGHSGWVTSLATSLENPNMLLSGSRDKTLIIWNLTRDDTSYGYPKRSLHGHSHIVSDCVSTPFVMRPIQWESAIKNKKQLTPCLGYLL